MVRVKFNLLIIIMAVMVISCSSRQEPAEVPAVPMIPEPTPAPAVVVAPTPEPAPIITPAPEPTPEPIPEPPRQEVVVPQEVPQSPATITEEYYIMTRAEVQQFIQRVNQIIRTGDYEGWRGALSPERFAEISSEEYLRQISEQPIMRTRRIVLRSAQDYFTHVVRPARANISEVVDDIDIEFVTMNRVMAFTITTSRTGEEQQVRLYDLEKIGNSWTIIN